MDSSRFKKNCKQSELLLLKFNDLLTTETDAKHLDHCTLLCFGDLYCF